MSNADHNSPQRQVFVVWQSDDEVYSFGEWNSEQTQFVRAETGLSSIESAKTAALRHARRDLVDAPALFVEDAGILSDTVFELNLLTDLLLDPRAFAENRARLIAENYAIAQEVLAANNETYMVRYCLDLDNIRRSANIEVTGPLYKDEDGDLVIDLEDGSRLPIFNGDELNAYVRGVYLAACDVHADF